MDTRKSNEELILGITAMLGTTLLQPARKTTNVVWTGLQRELVQGITAKNRENRALSDKSMKLGTNMLDAMGIML